MKPTVGLWLLLQAPDPFGGQRYMSVEPEDTPADLGTLAMRTFRGMYKPEDLELIEWSLEGWHVEPGQLTSDLREMIADVLSEIETDNAVG